MPEETYPTLPPSSIVIRRETRQRQLNLDNIDDLKASIVARGTLIHPIVVRRVGEEIILVAGERRLRAYLELNLPAIPVRFFADLSEEEAEMIELEENIKRRELHWRDYVRSIGRLHQMLAAKAEDKWSIKQSGDAIGMSREQIGRILHVYAALDNAKIANASGTDQAYNILAKFAERKAEAIVSELVNVGAQAFGSQSVPPEPIDDNQGKLNLGGEKAVPVATGSAIYDDYKPAEVNENKPPLVTATAPIICANFLEWAPAYVGPKFSLIHCDFPYGNYKGDASSGAMHGVEADDFYDNHEEIYWTLLDCLTANLDRLMSYSAHLVFWFNMNFYTETVRRLRQAGLMVHDHPFVWHKTPGGGGTGVLPGTATTYPRRTYDTALLAVRGNRPLANSGTNSYVAPTVGNKIHPSQKPEPMLRHFLSMVVDETTTVLDPTCGSGAALRAAEDLGAKSILGLELDPTYAASANARTAQVRVLRQAGTLRKVE